MPGDQLLSVQNYFAEYHLEYFRQRRYNHFPSRLHAMLQFATRTDAMTFRTKHPQRVFGKNLVCARTTGAYICSFHDASWLDYLRLPHSLSLSALDEVAEHYWSGRTVEEIGLTFMNEPWQEPPSSRRFIRVPLSPPPATPNPAGYPAFDRKDHASHCHRRCHPRPSWRGTVLDHPPQANPGRSQGSRRRQG
jgi:hypothetical protein